MPFLLWRELDPEPASSYLVQVMLPYSLCLSDPCFTYINSPLVTDATPASADGRWSSNGFGPLPKKTGLHSVKAEQALIYIVEAHLLNVTYFCTSKEVLKLYFINDLIPMTE